jgi:hypothetical protein
VWWQCVSLFLSFFFSPFQSAASAPRITSVGGKPTEGGSQAARGQQSLAEVFIEESAGSVVAVKGGGGVQLRAAHRPRGVDHHGIWIVERWWLLHMTQLVTRKRF